MSSCAACQEFPAQVSRQSWSAYQGSGLATVFVKFGASEENKMKLFKQEIIPIGKEFQQQSATEVVNQLTFCGQQPKLSTIPFFCFRNHRFAQSSKRFQNLLTSQLCEEEKREQSIVRKGFL